MIRFGAIVSVVAVAMGLLIVGAVAGDLKLVYVSIGLAALALVMLVAGVAIWRDEIFGASAKPPAKATAAEPELVGTSAHGGAPAAGVGGRRADRGGGRPTGRFASRPGDGRGPRPDRPDADDAAPSQSQRRRSGDDFAASSGRSTSARASHRSSGRPPHDGDTRVGPVPMPMPVAERERREREQRDREQRDREQRERSHRDWSRPASPADAPAAGVRPPAGGMGLGAAAQADSAGAASASRQQTGESQHGGTRPLPGQPAAVRPYAASAGGGAAAGADVVSRPSGSSERAASPEQPFGPGRTERAPSPPASPFFTPSSHGSPGGAGGRPGAPSRDEPARPPSTAMPARPERPDVSSRHATSARAASASASPKPVGGAPIHDAAAGDRGSAAATAPSSGNVTVVPGIARYHTADCILIRFLSPDDLETMTLQAAEKIGCVPCRACRPETPGANA